MINLSANISLLFKEYNFIERFEQAYKNDFKVVEFQFPYDFKPKIIQDELKKYKLHLSIFNSSPGDFESGDRGLACLPNRIDEFKKSIFQCIEYAKIFKCQNIHIMSGTSNNKNGTNFRDAYIENLRWACDQFAKDNLYVLIEPINQRNIPGYFLSSTDLAVDFINIIDRSNLKLLFDIYHHQIIRGNVTKYLEKYFPYIGHIQIAGIPNRNEPDDSELDYSYVFKVIKDLNYNGWIGCEYSPKEDTVSGLKWIGEVNL